LPARVTGDIEGNLVLRARGHGAVRTSIEIVLGSYVAIAAVMIGLGLLVTHFVVGGAIGRWDDSTVRWLVDHRSTGWTHLASNLSRLADTVTVLAVSLIVAIVLAVRRHWKQMLLLAIALPLELAVFSPRTSSSTGRGRMWPGSVRYQAHQVSRLGMSRRPSCSTAGSWSLSPAAGEIVLRDRRSSLVGSSWPSLRWASRWLACTKACTTRPTS
jgi:hypothetical protein